MSDFESSLPKSFVPEPKKKKARGAARMKELYGTRRPKVRQGQAKQNKVLWLASARVVDLDAFHRLKTRGVGAKTLARALATTTATAQKLMSGTHWQQNPEKVMAFNLFHKASISPDGVPTAEDLAKHGAPLVKISKYASDGEKELRRIIEDAGISPHLVSDAMRRMRLLTGQAAAGDLPGKPDTKYFQEQFDAKLALVLACLDPVAIASASVADLTRLASMLTEKRALLRGEPTAIVRNEQRGGLDKVAAALMAEITRRGITLDLPKTGYREVEG